jgi:hypothetical protein
MAFQWRDFLLIADELAMRGDEAAWRTAIGRAYYAALGVAIGRLPPAERVTVHPGNVHDRTWELYARSTVAECRRLGNLGYRIRNRRRAADYRDEPPMQALHAWQAVVDARAMLNLLDQHGYQP